MNYNIDQNWFSNWKHFQISIFKKHTTHVTLNLFQGLLLPKNLYNRIEEILKQVQNDDRLYLKLFPFIFLFFFSACSSDENRLKTDQEILAYKEPLVGVNKILVDKDSAEIASYCNRHKLSLSITKSGLWYKIYPTGKGDSAKTDKIAKIKYKISLLTGKVCYTSDSLGPKSFLIGQGGVESGLEIGILKMREGDKAKFIMPPNLAYGLLGDENRIPARSIIVYEVELIKLTDK